MKHLLYTLAIASGSLLALNANAKVGDLLPRPHQIELTAGAAPFALQRTVAITDPTGCTYLKNFFTTNMMKKIHTYTLIPMVEEDCLANLFYIVIGTHKELSLIHISEPTRPY